MAVLTAEQLEETKGRCCDELSREGEGGEIGGIGRDGILAAFTATDQWVDDNQASFNAALPEPAKSLMSSRQKVRMFMWVVKKRWEVT
jgi:hypothetical protein